MANVSKLLYRFLMGYYIYMVYFARYAVIYYVISFF